MMSGAHSLSQGYYSYDHPLHVGAKVYHVLPVGA